MLTVKEWFVEIQNKIKNDYSLQILKIITKKLKKIFEKVLTNYVK